MVLETGSWRALVETFRLHNNSNFSQFSSLRLELRQLTGSGQSEGRQLNLRGGHEVKEGNQF